MHSNKLKKILMVQPSLQPPGGGNSVCAWILEALKDDYEIHVLSWEPIELSLINSHYSTSLNKSEIIAHKPNQIVKFIVDCIPFPVGHLKRSLILRACKKIQQNFDVLITTNNEADFGRPGIQYIHYPWKYFPRPLVDIKWYHTIKFMVFLYYRFCAMISDYSEQRVKENFTLVNSDWTGEKVKACHVEIKTQTLYPPVINDFPKIPWHIRENGFICIGRISREKEILKIIDIIKRVRSLTGKGHLHIIGTCDDPVYYNSILKIVRKNSEWVFLEENLSREALTQLVAKHQFGIHGMVEEHFGISIAEMVMAGCLVFVPNGGGQKEIIGELPELLYETPEDAVDKIGRVIQDRSLLEKMRLKLEERRCLFSKENFIRKIRKIVDNFR